MNKKKWIIAILLLSVIIGGVYYNKYLKDKILIEKQEQYFASLNNKSNKDGFRRDDCEKVLIINKTNIPDYTTWGTTDFNNYSIVNYNCNFDASSCTADVVQFDTEKYFDNHKSDITKENFSKWLQDNGTKGYICFKPSYQNIEKAHRADLLLSGILSSVDADKTKTFQEILDIINEDDSTAYDNDQYDNYIHFYFNFWGTLKMELSPTFSSDGGYFSIQLLKSIIYRRNNNTNSNDDITPATEFEFRNVPLGYSQKRVVFSIKTGNGDEADFYDYSQIPPGTSDVNMYAFSPL
ncbi:hypothetical protein [Flavobacterium sp. 25HG05S-40]|uniref:hypothetical protein n=1 Tax=Flavobacterium sp. 25HG05S-40 TaxID=3458682 RepID=UPI00404415C8